MADPDRAGEKTIRSYAVWCGLTPLVPVPLVDDLARGYFRRRMVRALAAARGRPFTSDEVAVLTDDPRRGCLAGCLFMAVLYPIKKLLRKVLYFLELKRAVDTASATYHFGSLLDYALQAGWCGPDGRYDAARVRAAIEVVLKRQGTNPIEAAFRESFRRSKAGLRSAALGLRAALAGLRPRARKEQVEQALEGAPVDEGAPIASAVDAALAQVPPGYLAGLCRQLGEELER